MSPGSTNLDAWLQSVEGKPGIIRYELQPITDLLNSQYMPGIANIEERKLSLSKAINDFINRPGCTDPAA